MKGKSFFIGLLVVFCVFVVFITYCSKTLYTQKLKTVSLAFTEKGAFDHLYHLEGEITENIKDYYAAKFVLPVPRQTMKYVRPEVGDRLEITFPNDLTIEQTGKIIKKDYTEDGIIFIVGFDNNALSERILSGGLTAKLEWQSDIYDAVVPKDSLVLVGDQYYLLKVEAETGFLGKEYKAVYELVVVLDAYNGMAAVFPERDREVPYILHADELVSDGEKIRFFP